MRIDHRQKVLAIAAAICVGALAGDHLVYAPLTRVWRDRADRIAELRTDLDRSVSLLGRETSIRDRWARLQKMSLPGDASAAESKVLSAVERWTKSSGIGFSAIKPQWKQNGDDYKTLECRVDATGNIESLTRFLDELERDPLAVRVEDLELSARDEYGQQISLGVRFSALVLTGEQS